MLRRNVTASSRSSLITAPFSRNISSSVGPSVLSSVTSSLSDSRAVQADTAFSRTLLMKFLVTIRRPFRSTYGLIEHASLTSFASVTASSNDSASMTIFFLLSFISASLEALVSANEINCILALVRMLSSRLALLRSVIAKTWPV